jgi:Icc-related predicted phosphoesterase
VIRIAAVGDLHVGLDSRGTLRPAFRTLPGRADVLLLAGDLTRVGTDQELRVLLDELDGVSVPCAAVLGNHDYESDRAPRLTELLGESGVRVLEGSNAVFDIGGATLGVAGTKGFGGGFVDACGSEFGEPEMKAFVAHTRRLADTLYCALDELRTDARVALLHFAPVPSTLGAERPEIYPFLGSYLLGEAVDRAGADLVVHGHAHHGVEQGATPGGIAVRNVALPVIEQAFKLYALPATRAHRGRRADPPPRQRGA